MFNPKKAPPEKVFSDLKPPSKNQINEFFLIFLKLAIGICLLPALYAATLCFSGELAKLEGAAVRPFVWGIISFLVMYLFVWEPVIIFKKGQRVLEVIFRFFAPLVKVASFVLPIYPILISAGYFIGLQFFGMKEFIPLFIFGIGFSLALHLVFCAKTLRAKSGDKLKSNYIFGFGCIYILDALLLSLFFNLAFEHFSFLNFFNGSYQLSKGIYLAVFRQLFL